MSVDILGTRYSSPIVCAPVGGQRAFHDDAESGVARAAKTGDHLQILSTMTSDPVEDVIKARGAPIWFQLYATNKWEVAAAITKRAENAGCTARRRHRRPQRRPQPGNAVPPASRATRATATAATTASSCKPR